MVACVRLQNNENITKYDSTCDLPSQLTVADWSKQVSLLCECKCMYIYNAYMNTLLNRCVIKCQRNISTTWFNVFSIMNAKGEKSQTIKDLVTKMEEKLAQYLHAVVWLNHNLDLCRQFSMLYNYTVLYHNLRPSTHTSMTLWWDDCLTSSTSTSCPSSMWMDIISAGPRYCRSLHIYNTD